MEVMDELIVKRNLELLSGYVKQNQLYVIRYNDLILQEMSNCALQTLEWAEHSLRIFDNSDYTFGVKRKSGGFEVSIINTSTNHNFTGSVRDIFTHAVISAVLEYLESMSASDEFLKSI